jgi:hypothetical protein
MNALHFDAVVRLLGQRVHRRGAMAILGGLGAAAIPGLGAAKHRHRDRKSHRRAPRGTTASASAASGTAAPLVVEGDSDAESVGVNTTPVWQHAHLTATVKALQNDPLQVAALHQAIATWSGVLARHFGGVVTLTDITGQPHAKQTADIHLILSPRAYNPLRYGLYSGVAICGDDACDHVFVKDAYPNGLVKDLPFPTEFTTALVYQTALHELGHVLGLGHAAPFGTTNDIMGAAYDPASGNPSPPIPVISTCDLQVLEAMWRWAVDGTAPPAMPTMTEIMC